MTSQGEITSSTLKMLGGLSLSLDDISFMLKGYHPKTFEDSDLLDAKSYKLTILKDSELTPIAKSFLKALENNTIGATTTDQALLLASQLRSVETGRTKTQRSEEHTSELQSP